MRLHVALFVPLLIASAAFAQTASAPRTFPYKAYITANEVYVRSGPGENYYPTEKVKAGTEVEVYRHDPGGWYAIRPLPESYSWVSGRFLKKGKDGLAEVTGDRVQARVGSQFSEIKDVGQVRLERGEAVEIRSEKQIATGADAVTWYKIAPPSGEFRWVFGKYVDPDYSRDGVRKTSAETTQAAQTAATASPAATRRSATAAPADDIAPRESQEPGVAVQPGRPQPAASSGAAMRHLSPQEFQKELDDVNTELSLMLAEEATVWNCEELKQRAQALVDQAQTAVERGRARVLFNRLAQADDIKRRYEMLNVARTDVERRNRTATSVAQTTAQTNPAPDPTASPASSSPRTPSPRDRFDGVGRLTRVVPPTLGAPRYALVDDRGNVRAYVSPAPGVNMNYYLGHRVGVNGTRDYLPDQRAEHVTAKHITALDTRLR